MKDRKQVKWALQLSKFTVLRELLSYEQEREAQTELKVGVEICWKSPDRKERAEKGRELCSRHPRYLQREGSISNVQLGAGHHMCMRKLLDAGRMTTLKNKMGPCFILAQAKK